jgi:hypothetical protein
MIDDLDATYRPHLGWHPETQTWRLFIIKEGVRGERAAVVRLTYEPLDRHGSCSPTLELGDGPMRAMLQQLVNEAARMGIVPNDAATTMAATRQHLADMRAIVANQLQVDLPRTP